MNISDLYRVMTPEQKLKRIGDRQTLSLMISYLIAILGAFLVMAFV